MLAAILVLNGTLAPLQMSQAMTNADPSSSAAAKSMESHCHRHAVAKPDDTRRAQEACSCGSGSACQCDCVATLALPMTFLDLRPLAAQHFVAHFGVPQFAVAPPNQLLRPPIA